MQDWEREFEPEPVSAEEEFASPADLELVPEEFDHDTAGVLEEIDRLQQRKSNWGATLLVLIVSGLLFYWIGSAAWNLKTVGLLIPILLFHELGHYLAMLAFGYRNLRMFFIPLFGAAVTGRNYNVAAWKKAVVSLMGPLPGIGLGVGLGIASLVLHQKLLLEAAGLMVFINGINLLPILPLDGGWNLHAILFSRHYLLDVGFRFVAAVLMILGGVLLKEYFLTYLGAAMMFGLPMEYRRSQIVARLRQERFAARSLDSQTIPEATARRIIQEIHASFPKRLSDKAAARLTLQIFESLNARPPGWFAVVALAGAQAGGFVVALAFSILFFVALHANPNQLNPLMTIPRKRAVELPMHSVSQAELRTWRGAQAAAPVKERRTLIGTFADRKQAEAAFQDFTGRLPPQASAELFGQSLLVTLPADAQLEKKWQAELKAKCPDVRSELPKSPVAWTFLVTAPNEEAATRIQHEANLYLSLARRTFLVPPWSPQPLTAEQRRARATYSKVHQVRSDLFSEPRFANQTRDAFKELGKDNVGGVKLRETFQRVQQETLTEAIAKVRKEGEKSVDFRVLDLYATVASPRRNAKPKPAALTDAEQQLYQRFGQLPLDHGKPQAGTERFSVLGGYLVRTGKQLRLRWLTFKQVEDGLPALSKWLADEKCVELKYRIEPAAPETDDDDEAAID